LTRLSIQRRSPRSECCGNRDEWREYDREDVLHDSCWRSDGDQQKTETTEVLHSIRDVYNGQLRVIRVNGESMSPVLHDGDKVTFDIRLVTPQDGDVVAVYDSLRGGIVGYWRRGENGEYWLDKENASFHSELLEAHGGWTLWGTVTRIVDTPMRPRRPSHH
jgi:hypothetical protein